VGKNPVEHFRKMSSIAHAALGITPMLLLAPRKSLNDVGSKETLFHVSLASPLGDGAFKLVQFSKALGSKPVVFDDLERLMWKIVVEGLDDLEGQLRSLQALYQERVPQAQCHRTWFRLSQSLSSDGFEELRHVAHEISSIGEHQITSNGEQTLETDSVALTCDSSPHPPVQMDCDLDEVTVYIQPDGGMQSEAGTQRVLDHDEDVVTGDNGSTPSKAGGDATTEITHAPVTETLGPMQVRESSPAAPTSQRDSLPAITVHSAARETDSEGEMSAEDEPVRDTNRTLHTPSTSKQRRPHSKKLIQSAKLGRIPIPARRIAVPKHVVMPVGREDMTTSKRKRVEDQPRDVSASPVGCRHVLDIEGAVSCSVLTILKIHGDTSPKPEPANDLQRGIRVPVSV
jgi:hypothetical protein